MSKFDVYIRCENCMRESVKRLNVPRADGAPLDVEDLVESGLLSSLVYACARCGSVIGQVTEIMQLQCEALSEG